MLKSVRPAVLRIYRDYFARFLVFRLLKACALGAYRSGYRLRCSYVNNPLNKLYRFESLSGCSSKTPVKRIPVFASSQVVIPPPDFAGFFAKEASEKNGMIQIESPSLSIFEFDHCMLVGGVDFVFVGDMAVHHDLFVPSVHNCPAENLGLISMKRKENALSLNVSRPPSTLETGISLIGQCSGNYAHWLTETLPKLAVLNVFREYENVPLLVDDGLHPNMYESIQFINENRREVIRVKYGEPVLINRLVTTSAPSYERYVPHGVDSHEAEPYINRFSRPALCKLRSSVSSGMLDTAYAVSKRIYLARGRKSGNIRQITNASEIEATVLANGFRCVDPEAMTFKDQASACIGAEAIVAPVGASLANMIFAPPGCKIIVLAPYYGEASYFYYSNLAGVLGHEVHYILGKQTKCRRHPIHRDYYVDPEVLACALRTVVGA